MDWVDYDYEDLSEYLNEKHPDKYDGFVIDEGADGGYGEEVKSRGLSYVPYSASQIKSATINNGDFSRENDDIRFQLIGETGAKSLTAVDLPTCLAPLIRRGLRFGDSFHCANCSSIYLL